MGGGAGVGGNENEDVKSSQMSPDKSTRDEQNRKKRVVLIFLLAFCWRSPKRTLIAKLQLRLWECSRNKINEAKVVRILYFKAVSLVFRNLAIK